MITHIGGRNMLAMYRSCTSGNSISGMALYCQLRTYHFLGTIILYGIWISRDSTSAIQKIAVLEMDDMSTGVTQGPPSSLTQIVSFTKKVQSIIRTCIVLSVEPVPDHGTRGVKKGARRLPGGGARGGHALAPPHPGRRGYADPRRGGERGQGSGRRECGDLGSSDHGDPFDSPDLDMPSFSLGGLGTSYASPTPSFGFSSFRSPPPPSLGFSSFQAPPSPGTVSSCRHVLLRARLVHLHRTSSSDSHEDDEQTYDMTSALQLGFGHYVGKKTTRFTPSDWP
ncbi:hypothetical protein M9H77_00084 [Catharanthus roseus]|nr:hypothetical protein M9H77_00084 [Catharanthus roseus]